MPGTRSRFASAGLVWEQRSTADKAHLVLDAAGMVPVLGEPADRLDAAISAGRGRHGEAALSAAAAIPVVGNLGTGAKLLGKTAKLADEAVGAVRGRRGGNVPCQWGELGGGLGATDRYGNITTQRGLTGRAFEETLRHESVHRALSPRSGPSKEARANLNQWSYAHPGLRRYIEEGIAEGYATRSIRRGLQYPIQEGYRSAGRVAAEGALAAGGVAAAGYGLYNWWAE